MKKEIQIVKRLEIVKTSLELGDRDIAQLHILKLQEENIDELNEIIKNFNNNNNIDVNNIIKLIDNYLFKPKENNLTPHQQSVFDMICLEFENILNNKNIKATKQSNFVSLYGSAGVGKTYVSSKLIEYFIKKMDYKILLTTPTHKSLSVAKYMLSNINIKVPTKTLQSYLDVKLFTDYDRGTKRFMRDKIDLQSDYEKDLDILIVDESSMISDDLLKFIEENLKQNKLKSALFIGDHYQLPPVDESQNSIEQLTKKFELIEVVRQAKESYIKIIANELKECIKNKKFLPISEIIDLKKYSQMEVFYEEKSLYDSFVTDKNWYKDNIILSYTNKNVDEFNRILRLKYWLQKNVFPNEPIIKGELLVFNDSFKTTIQNSEMITVLDVKKKENHSIILKDEDNSTKLLEYFECISSDGREFKTVVPEYYKLFNKFLEDLSSEAKEEKDKEKRRLLWKRYFAIKEDYADLKYIHASTIHKSQGSTYKNVYIDLASLIQLSYQEEELAFRLMYLAVTRASEHIKILF